METVLGKNESCTMTTMSGALDKLVIGEKTNLLKISEKKDKHRYLQNGGGMICSFLTDDKIYK